MLLMAIEATFPLCISQELEEDHAVSPDSEGGAYDFLTDGGGGDDMIMSPMIDLAS